MSFNVGQLSGKAELISPGAESMLRDKLSDTMFGSVGSKGGKTHWALRHPKVSTKVKKIGSTKIGHFQTNRGFNMGFTKLGAITEAIWLRHKVRTEHLILVTFIVVLNCV